MKRRTWLHALLAWAGIAGAKAAETKRPIQLNVDLAVDPDREAEMLELFQTQFRPAAAKQPGYIDLKLLKLTSALHGQPPGGANYRFCLTFASEELRQKWVATPTHQKLWPVMEGTLKSKDYTRLLYEVY
jgi:antibiotic biosynthesis monooxygenase (ABM) superfamily enzyme